MPCFYHPWFSLYYQRNRPGKTGYAFWYGTAYLCTDYCSGSHYVCLDHGYASSLTAGGFHKDPYACCNVDPHTAYCKLFGVFGFSIMFNSPVRLACSAAVLGAVANTLRLELVDLAALPPAVTAFIGALTAGLLASLLKNKVGYPRISVTVPSIVIMVPGLYLYRGFYNLGIMSLSVSASWFAAALLIIAALPLGLIFARILTDKAFRYCT